VKKFLHQYIVQLCVLIFFNLVVIFFLFPNAALPLAVLTPSVMCFFFALYVKEKKYAYYVCLPHIFLTILVYTITYGLKIGFAAIYTLLFTPLSMLSFLVATDLFLAGRWLFKKNWYWVSVLPVIPFVPIIVVLILSLHHLLFI
jgi:hypothetical protein